MKLTINTVVQTLNLGEIQIKADRRSTKETPIPEDQRIRRIVLPANHWGSIEATLNTAKSQGLTDILRSALTKLGDDRLKDILAETPMAREVSADDFTVAELLKWSEETATSRGSITFTREDAEKWYDNGSSRKALQAKWEAANLDADIIKAQHAFLRNRYGALAAKNHGLKDEAEATKAMTLIDATDAATAIGTEIVGRLEHIAKQLAAKAAEATVNMASL